MTLTVTLMQLKATHHLHVPLSAGNPCTCIYMDHKGDDL